MSTLDVILLVLVLLAACGGWWVGRRHGAVGARAEVASELAEARTAARLATEERSRADELWLARVHQLQEEIARLNSEREHVRAADEQRRLDESRDRARVLEALAPLRDRLNGMSEAVARMERHRQEQYGAIGAQLVEARAVDEKLLAATGAIEQALRNSSTRGAWGEAQLRNLVEAAGLVEKVDFDVQVTTTVEASRLRPDMVVHLPGGRLLPVDAKTPFAAYLEAQGIDPSADGADGERRARLLAEHVKAVRGHVDALAKKAYWEALGGGVDFVVAFIPSEALLGAALEADPTLLDHAFERKVALVSPVSLWSLLRVVAHGWNEHELSEQAEEIIAVAKEFHGRLATLAVHADKLRSSIAGSVEAWNSFAGSLERRVLVSARRLSALDPQHRIGEVSAIDAGREAMLTSGELRIDGEQ